MWSCSTWCQLILMKWRRPNSKQLIFLFNAENLIKAHLTNVLTNKNLNWTQAAATPLEWKLLRRTWSLMNSCVCECLVLCAGLPLIYSPTIDVSGQDCTRTWRFWIMMLESKIWVGARERNWSGAMCNTLI
jgi:hypothetical protein